MRLDKTEREVSYESDSTGAQRKKLECKPSASVCSELSSILSSLKQAFLASRDILNSGIVSRPQKQTTDIAAGQHSTLDFVLLCLLRRLLWCATQYGVSLRCYLGYPAGKLFPDASNIINNLAALLEDSWLRDVHRRAFI